MVHNQPGNSSAVVQAHRFRVGPIETSRAIRRALLAETAGLDPTIDAAIGKSSAVRARAVALPASLSGPCWCAIEPHLSFGRGILLRLVPRLRSGHCSRFARGSWRLCGKEPFIAWRETQAERSGSVESPCVDSRFNAALTLSCYLFLHSHLRDVRRHDLFGRCVLSATS
jgi:hypothetical protein